MSLSAVSSVKLGSRRLWPSVLAATVFGLSAGLVGCIFVDDSSDRGHVNENPQNDPPLVTDPLQVNIDTGETLTTTPGEGAGVFVEYAEDDTGGHWHVFTACDTNITSKSCQFDVWLTHDASSKITNVKGGDFGPKDVIDVQSDGTVHFFANTTDNLAGVTFDTEPGAMVELYLLLGGVEDPRFIYWVGDGILHQGAPTDPVDFKPTKITK